MGYKTRIDIDCGGTNGRRAHSVRVDEELLLKLNYFSQSLSRSPLTHSLLVLLCYIAMLFAAARCSVCEMLKGREFELEIETCDWWHWYWYSGTMVHIYACARHDIAAYICVLYRVRCMLLSLCVVYYWFGLLGALCVGSGVVVCMRTVFCVT